jgi:hypothetical protein
MSLTFKSSTPESFQITGRDRAGRIRTATATRDSGGNRWDLRLQHPSGRHWEGTFFGPNVIDGLAELLVSKDAEFRQDAGRGDRPHTEAFDYNRRLPDDGTATPIVGIPSNRR